MWTVIQVLLIIILIMVIIVLGNYTYNQLNRPKLKLPSFMGRGFLYRFTLITAIIFVLTVIGVIVANIDDPSYYSPGPATWEPIE